jgi:DNA primase catalytic core
MPGFLGDDQVRKVREATDLVQLMSEYTPVRKAGANFTCCCPFHQERTPSMYIYTGDQHYYCFGCKAHGDAITLTREKENVSFADAVEMLAKRAGIELAWQQGSGRNRDERGARDRQLAALEFACAHYETCLWESVEARDARAYLLERRRLSEATCRRFRVGWAPGRGQLIDAARRQGFDAGLLAELDLAVERSGRMSDRFFERITFPICDRFGHPLAFSARLLPEAEAAAKAEGRGVGKYVNNTDTPLYHKSSSVFNFHHARTACRDERRLVVMEGPTDVMAADQAGFKACVAVLGTAFTPEHAKQLGTVVGREGRLILLLDGDRAGQENALKAARTCLAAGVPAQVAILPDELDPAELLAEAQAGSASREVFERVLSGARAEFDHLLRALAPRPTELDRRAQLAVADQILAAIRGEPDRELRDLHLRDAAGWLGLPEDALARRLAAEAQPRAAARDDEAEDAGPPAPDPLPQHLDEALHILVRERALRAAAGDELGLEPRHWPAPWGALAAAVLLADPPDLHALAEAEGVAGAPALIAAVHRYAAEGLDRRIPAITDPAARLGEIAATLRQGELQRRLRAIDHELAEARRSGDRSAETGLLAERFDLQRRLRAR